MISNRLSNISLAITVYRKSIIRIASVTAGIMSLSGCLLTSPYWNQEFENHSSAIPLQAWTTDKTKQVKFECAKAFHGGLYPSSNTATWVLIDNVGPQQHALLDSFGNSVYGAGKTAVLPATCWRQDTGNFIWYSAVRATQGTGASKVTYKTFDASGLECLGGEDGKATSWFGYLNQGCTKTYSNSSTEIPYVIFRAIN